MNRFSSIFSQLLQLFPRTEFQQAVKETRAERHARGFTCWGQFVSMLFCQLGRAHSLREIIGGLRSCEGKFKHLGITAPNRSTLAYANEHRPWELYQKVFLQLLERCRMQVGGRKKFRFKNKLVSLDSTTIDLCLSIFDWARFRRTKGAIKLHLLLDHDGYLPEFAWITEGKVADVKVAQQLHFAPGTIVVDDRGYTDYALWGRWCSQRVYFVTRMKDNALYEVVGERKVPQNRHVLKDEMIELRGPQAIEKCPYPLRRIEVYDPGNGGDPGLLDQSPEVGSDHDCCHLQRPLADRDLLQSSEAEPQDQDLCGDQPQCRQDSNLDSIDRDADPAVPSTSISIQLVPFESGGLAANESVYPSRSLGLAQSSVPDCPSSL